MIIYLTYNDLPSGVFSSQVVDVVNYYNQEFNAKVKLVSLISIRNFFENKKQIKAECSNSIVIPIFPGVHRWFVNYWLLAFIFLVLKPKKIIGRSVLATQLALKFKNKNCKIIYDGRGAIAAEWNEYNVVNSDYLEKKILEWEKEAVLNTDFRISVSHKLVEYWKQEFKYKSNEHVVIPCTLNYIYDQIELSEKSIANSRNLLGLRADDIVFAYSGSIAGWQSFNLLYNFISPILKSSFNNKILFLSAIDANINKLQAEFGNQVLCKKVNHIDVPKYLVVADYGLLIREETITNKVASPVKFAEYLACGLKVIISENLGDFTSLVSTYKCGIIYTKWEKDISTDIDEKKIINKLSKDFFKKSNYRSYFKKIINQ